MAISIRSFCTNYCIFSISDGIGRLIKWIGGLINESIKRWMDCWMGGLMVGNDEWKDGWMDGPILNLICIVTVGIGLLTTGFNYLLDILSSTMDMTNFICI